MRRRQQQWLLVIMFLLLQTRGVAEQSFALRLAREEEHPMPPQVPSNEDVSLSAFRHAVFDDNLPEFLRLIEADDQLVFVRFGQRDLFSHVIQKGKNNIALHLYSHSEKFALNVDLNNAIHEGNGALIRFALEQGYDPFKRDAKGRDLADDLIEHELASNSSLLPALKRSPKLKQFVSKLEKSIFTEKWLVRPLNYLTRELGYFILLIATLLVALEGVMLSGESRANNNVKEDAKKKNKEDEMKQEAKSTSTRWVRKVLNIRGGASAAPVIANAVLDPRKPSDLLIARTAAPTPAHSKPLRRRR